MNEMEDEAVSQIIEHVVKRCSTRTLLNSDKFYTSYLINATETVRGT